MYQGTSFICHPENKFLNEDLQLLSGTHHMELLTPFVLSPQSNGCVIASVDTLAFKPQHRGQCTPVALLGKEVRNVLFTD